MNDQHRRNQRGHERRSAYIIVEYKVKEGVFRDIIKSVSAGGVCIKARRGIAAHQIVALQFSLFRFIDLVAAVGEVIGELSPTSYMKTTAGGFENDRLICSACYDSVTITNAPVITPTLLSWAACS